MLVDVVEDESADRRNIAPEGKDACAGGHDFVCRDVVPDPEQHGSFQVLGQRVEDRKRLNIRPFLERHAGAVGWWRQHVVLEYERLRLGETWISHRQGGGIKGKR